MDVTKFSFPKVTALDMAFSTQKTIPDLLVEARTRGFYNGDTPFNKLFGQLFYGGRKDIKFKNKEGLNTEFQQAATAYFKAFIGSFEPKHEEKEAICALLLSELVTIEE